MNKNKLSRIFLFISILAFLAVGILMIAFSKAEFERTNYFFGSILIGTAIPPIIWLLAKRDFKEPFKIPFFVLLLGSIAMGATLLCSNQAKVGTMCVMWGIYSSIYAFYSIFDSFRYLKVSKLEIVEIIASIVEIVFSILLIINKDEAVDHHLIIAGVIFIIKAVTYFLECIIEIKHSKQQ
ncbi:MAG: hypothetical protein MJ221_01910 [Bacilli bacterium]|nr:hypothetical protein [Bacilli bacterium]